MVKKKQLIYNDLTSQKSDRLTHFSNDKVSKKRNSFRISELFWVDKIGINDRTAQLWQNLNQVADFPAHIFRQGAKAQTTLDRAIDAINVLFPYKSPPRFDAPA